MVYLLLELGGNNAPELDGFIMEFLVKNWQKLKGRFKNLFDDFHRNGKLNACVQENFICLLQNKEDAVHAKRTLDSLALQVSYTRWSQSFSGSSKIGYGLNHKPFLKCIHLRKTNI